MSERAMTRSSGAWIVAVAVAALVVAEVAALALAPSVPEPGAPASAETYFSDGLVAEGGSYREGQRRLGLASLVLELGVLALVATAGMGVVRRLRARLGSREWLAAAGLGVALALLVFAVTLAPRLIAHERAVDFGISTQGLWEWLADRGGALAFGLLFAAVGAALLIWLQRRLPRLWWVAGAGVVVAFAIVQSWLAPVVIAPAFNDFEPLPPGPVRADVLELAERAGVEVGEVYEVDASRRGTSFNAYVSGIGGTRRVVIYDNLLDGAERAALRSVVAHELGHVAARDIWRGIAFVAIVAPLGMLLVRLVGDRLALRAGTGPGRAAALPAYAFAIAVVSFGLGLVGNQLSRAVERKADRFALELTEDPQGLVCLQQRIGAANLSDPDPAAGWQLLFGTHPTKLERIGAAEAYARELGEGPPSPSTCRDGGGSRAGSG